MNNRLTFDSSPLNSLKRNFKDFSVFLCRKVKKKKFIRFSIVVLFIVFFWFSLPRPLFNDPYSTVLTDYNLELLGAKLAGDGQWRFPESEEVPEKFKKAILTFEDQYFYYHPGINPVSTCRALYQYISEGRIVSGGSTLTMQVIRLARKNKSRTIFEKFIEIYLAFRLECSFTKSEILALYASHAPFGGNVVGIDAASWRYFGVDADNLSWAQAATLAVLPNSPALIYPGKNHEKLLAKRNKLLAKLYEKGEFDRATLTLALSEPLPEKPYPLPQIAPHLLIHAIQDGHEGIRITSTIDLQLQENVNKIIELHKKILEANEIHNAAALVLDVNTGNVLAYIGNTTNNDAKEFSNDVDIIHSPRSTGSVLKPYLYAAMLNDGLILPTTLVPDIPTQLGGFIPENYNRTYDGAVPAKRALARSLNIPAVKMLQSYDYNKFYSLLKKLGLTTLSKSADHYGLSLILGGAEAQLWDLAGIYASLARTLNHFNLYGKYNKDDFHKPVYFKKEAVQPDYTDATSVLNASSIWLTFEAMEEAARPDEDSEWKQFSSSTKIAWKTGTSFGNRDAWAIGVTPDYVVAVWAGNASGEGRAGCIGLQAAAPILFDIFKLLKPTDWFAKPESEMVEIPVCRYSGYRASSLCELTDSIWIPIKCLKTAVCPYHIIVHLDPGGNWQVNSNCTSIDSIVNTTWFVLPPAQEWYFKNKNAFYKSLPPFKDGCLSTSDKKSMEMIYPDDDSKIYIPVDIDGKPGSTVFKLAHHNPDAVVFWTLDNSYIGSTSQTHQMELSPGKGKHSLTVVDKNGESLTIKFSVESKDDKE